MSGDSRWTGGAANREWQRGAKQPVTLLTADYLTAHVRAYLADCYAARETLNPAYHPTAAGALKVIYHEGIAQADQIRRAFNRK